MPRSRQVRDEDGGAPQFTDAGARRLDEQGAVFRNFLTTMGAINARKRGAQDVDNSDVDQAFRSLLSRRSRPLAVDIGAEFFLFAAGAAVGYAVTLLTQTPPATGPGWVLLVVGLLMGGFCALLKHIDFQ